MAKSLGQTTARELSRASSQEDHISGNHGEVLSIAHDLVPSERHFIPGWRFYLLFLSLTIIMLMVALDATSLPIALPIIASGLNGSALEAFWSGTSFLLTSAVSQAVLGSFSRIFDRKYIMLSNLIMIGAGSIIAACANSFTLLLLGRCFQGIAAGGIVTTTDVIIAELVPLRQRGRWFAFITSAWAIGTINGPIIGGAFAQKASWRWIFWINVPLAGTGALFVILFLPSNNKPTGYVQKLRQIDWIGTFLFVASLTGFLVALTWGGVQYPWNHWRTLFPLILCSLGLVIFVIWEEHLLAHTKVDPLICLDDLKSRTGMVTFLGTFIHGMLVWLIIYFQPFYFELIKDQTPIHAGVSLFPQTLTVTPVCLVAGFVISSTGRYRWAIWGGWSLTVGGLGLLTLLKETTTTPAWASISIVSGIGVGLLFCALVLTAQAASTKNITYTIILFAIFRTLGQTAGVAVGGTVFQNVMKKELRQYPLLSQHAEEYSRDLTRLVEIVKKMPLGLQKTQILHSYMNVLKAVYIMCAAFAAVGLLASLWTEHLSLDQDKGTEQELQGRDNTGFFEDHGSDCTVELSRVPSQRLDKVV